jgi:tetratricopeptide (TPR) repeat protein
MNEKGLFIDINAIPSSGWRNSPDKPDFNGDVVQEVLTRFETVEEVVRFFGEYDIDLGWVKYVVADASGDSAIFEWLADTVHVVRKDGPYLISTNYLSPREHTEPRYQIAEKILAQPAEPSVAQMRRVLSGTAYDVYISQTLYSTICDLRAKTLNVYHFHNFEEVVTFDLLKELEKGEVKLPIPELFDIRPHYEFWFNASSAEIGADDLARAVEEHGVVGAIERFDKMRADTRSYNKYIFEEWSLRSLGLNYMINGRLPEAAAILELAAGLYPDSWEMQVALAEARLASGQKDLAIRSYQKALSINPDDADIKGALDKLRQ